MIALAAVLNHEVPRELTALRAENVRLRQSLQYPMMVDRHQPIVDIFAPIPPQQLLVIYCHWDEPGDYWPDCGRDVSDLVSLHKNELQELLAPVLEHARDEERHLVRYDSTTCICAMQRCTQLSYGGKCLGVLATFAHNP